jgi:hypothetical protein
MSLRGYIKRGRPALWKQIQDEAGEVTYALNVRAEIRRQEREAKRNDEFRRRRIEAAKRQRERQQAKPPKRIAPMSARRRSELTDYAVARRVFLKQRPNCEACAKLTGLHPCVDAKPHPATDIHHKRGRLGKLLHDQRYWIPCCQHAHDFIHRNPVIARALDLLAQPGQWNKIDTN